MTTTAIRPRDFWDDEYVPDPDADYWDAATYTQDALFDQGAYDPVEAPDDEDPNVVDDHADGQVEQFFLTHGVGGSQ